MGLDLATEWRSRRWRRLLNIIDGLPRNWAFVEAVTSDEEWAETVLKHPQPPAPARVMSQWSPELEMLTNVYDRLGELIQVVAASHGGKPRRVPAAPRPVTALDRVRRRRARQQHLRLVAQVLPGAERTG